jgi:hypothetical protein
MVEPSRSAPSKRLLNCVRIGLPCGSGEEELSCLENTLQERLADEPRAVLLLAEAGIGEMQRVQELRSGTLRRSRQVGYGRSYEALALPYQPVIERLQARLDQPSLKTEHRLSTNRQDRGDLHYWAALAHHRE